MRNYCLRSLFVLVWVFFSTIGFAQDTATVQWKGTVETDAAGNTRLLLSGTIPAGWHLYAAADSTDALEGLRLRINDSVIDARGRKWAAAFQAIEDPVFEGRAKQVARDSVRFEQVLPKERTADVYLITLEYEIGKADQFIPEKATLKITTGATTATEQYRIRIPSIDVAHPKTNCGIESAAVGTQQSKSLWGLFLLGFAAGLVALLTPCVFPMIPLTVSFFTKKAASRSAGVRNALLYGFFIFFIYVLLSLPFHFLDQLDPEILNNISTNAWLNLAFFIIFVVFAFSFFGFYDISLPASFSGTADRKAGVGKIVGIFFMALTLAIVSFSCTGPILGSLLAGSLSADGGAMQLTAGMAGFGFALALPFALFALFPHWLQSLPKSGGWLHTVKVVLGFAELALALKFLSNADLVSHWGILKREIFIGLWVLISVGLALYLLGFLRFKHEAPLKKIHPFRLSLGLLVGAFAFYLLPGLTNTRFANLKLISGFPPPMYYSIYQKDSDCILGLTCSHNYEAGMKLARELKKPVLLDFTGYACVNCRRMEENVWTDPEVYELMKKEFVVISLYVDDKAKLPPAARFTYTTKEGYKKEIKTYGDVWATFETENFANNAQPLYAVLNNNEELLTEPVGYTETSAYLRWLQCSLAQFRK